MASDSIVNAEPADPLAGATAIVRRLWWYGAIVIVVLVALGVLFRHYLAWGDVATWILAVTTLLALIAAGFAALVAYGVLQMELRRDVQAVGERERAERAAKAAEEQASIQRQLREDAAQPYVWADVRPDEEHGVLLELIVGNSGPTIATGVKVKIEPPLPSIPELEGAQAAQAMLGQGLKSLPPGRTLRWWLGQGWSVLTKDGPQIHRFTITASGPFGEVPELSYDIDLAEFRGQESRAQGSLKGLTEAVTKLTEPVKAVANKLSADQPMSGSRSRPRTEETGSG